MTIWKELSAYRESHEDRTILSLLTDERVEEFSIRLGDLLFDYSKTNLDHEGRDLLLKLARETGVMDRREAMFRGDKINETEDRAVLHTALRDLDREVVVDGQDVMPEVRETLDRMCRFAEHVRSGRFRVAGRRVTDVVNIGIGGSDLGPAMATIALRPYHTGPRVHFVSNVDGAHIHDTLDALDPHSTLFIVASKTFTTQETMANAEAARRWLSGTVLEPAGHFVALSSSLEKTCAFGIPEERVFGFEDWVGGRYSMWGPIGLSLMIAIGSENFRRFLAGGQSMDEHFRTAPLVDNIPVMLALIGIWHAQVCGYATRAVLPYDQRLSRLAAYLQQLDMESNGKRVRMDGSDLTVNSGPIVWGEPGTNGQHAFFQLIHQGTRIVPCEFLVAAEGHEPEYSYQHQLLISNCLAQAEALVRGRSLEEARAKVAAQGLSGAELERQARHRVFLGNRPSTTLIYRLLTPFVLGQIIALYEHRVFVEGVILGINSFDQWGVELGKELAATLVPVVQGKQGAEKRDASTRMLVNYIRDSAQSH
ncbi:glucose-6-phosphate isomerase [Haematobacter missouriensis]|uniref:Glucose-6-phosphate isomerase n=1 Tax=Haematobacter missouriensis TaxID=366616 RepID=A0ABX3ZS72_9RHOB|nr:glucose-6-phosphate isomerase [Haematobacter missouriensis]KFI33883.1 glucose-6-phosphate isomerase [Haematobacter missouriensis]OWJ71345.1 glucose-6-phosphate isomerase [Haematobacter missouriensis]